jgi:hypothetical protein
VKLNCGVLGGGGIVLTFVEDMGWDFILRFSSVSLFLFLWPLSSFRFRHVFVFFAFWNELSLRTFGVGRVLGGFTSCLTIVASASR